MKKTLVLWTAILCLAFSDVRAGNFEGSLVMKLKTEVEGKPLAADDELAQVYEQIKDCSFKISVKGDKMAFQPNGTVAGVDMSMMRMIMDKKAGTYVVLMDMAGMRTGTRMKMDNDAKKEDKDKKVKKDLPQLNITKETRTINGYKCTKVISKVSDSLTIEMWTAKDVKLDMGDFFSMVQGVPGADTYSKYLKEVGFPMEYRIISNSGGSKITVSMLVDEIRKANIDESVFSTDGYSLQDMNLPVGSLDK